MNSVLCKIQYRYSIRHLMVVQCGMTLVKDNLPRMCWITLIHHLACCLLKSEVELTTASRCHNSTIADH